MIMSEYIKYELEDFVIYAKSTALKEGYDFDILDQKNIIHTLSDTISQISKKYELWKIIPKIEFITDACRLFYYTEQIDIYDGNLNVLYQYHDFTPYYGEEELNIGEGMLFVEINLSAEFAESLIFMSSDKEEEALRSIEDLLERTDIIVNFDVSGGRIYLEVPIVAEVVKYLI
jgi:hypothetical protein